MNRKILIICTGNTCRSQMVEGFLKSLDNELSVYSAGTNPEEEVNPYAVKVMKEKGIDISGQYPKNVNKYTNNEFDYVITVCDNAKETCPYFSGSVKHRIHIGFEDPAEADGTTNEILIVYRKIRDQIIKEFTGFYGSID